MAAPQCNILLTDFPEAGWSGTPPRAKAQLKIKVEPIRCDQVLWMKTKHPDRNMQ